MSISKPLTPHQAKIQSSLNKWLEIKNKMDALKEQELELRFEIINTAFPNLKDNADAEGVFTFEFSNGSNIKTDAKFNVKIDAEVLSSIKEELITEDLIPIDLIFNYRPTLSTSNYKKLNSDQREKLNTVLLFERATPTLKYNPPKPSADQKNT